VDRARGVFLAQLLGPDGYKNCDGMSGRNKEDRKESWVPQNGAATAVPSVYQRIRSVAKAVPTDPMRSGVVDTVKKKKL
jgi:hypothetical protein